MTFLRYRLWPADRQAGRRFERGSRTAGWEIPCRGREAPQRALWIRCAPWAEPVKTTTRIAPTSTVSLSLLQRVALLHSHLKHVIKRAADDEELGFQYRLLTR
jgi:hypothetical protein